MQLLNLCKWLRVTGRSSMHPAASVMDQNIQLPLWSRMARIEPNMPVACQSVSRYNQPEDDDELALWDDFVDMPIMDVFEDEEVDMNR